MNLEATIEAILFWRSEPMAIKRLAEVCQTGEAEINQALEKLSSNLAGRGVVLIRNNDEVMLGTTPAASSLIERLTKEELAGELSRAGLETVSIVLYQGPIARAEIDYIRGVNSSFVLRHLQIRGLVEKIVNPKDGRSFLYRPTFELLQHLGVTRVEDLPEYGEVGEELARLQS